VLSNEKNNDIEMIGSTNSSSTNYQTFHRDHCLLLASFAILGGEYDSITIGSHVKPKDIPMDDCDATSPFRTIGGVVVSIDRVDINGTQLPVSSARINCITINDQVEDDDFNINV
jgi:hypothetical protein